MLHKFNTLAELTHHYNLCALVAHEGEMLCIDTKTKQLEILKYEHIKNAYRLKLTDSYEVNSLEEGLKILTRNLK